MSCPRREHQLPLILKVGLAWPAFFVCPPDFRRLTCVPTPQFPRQTAQNSRAAPAPGGNVQNDLPGLDRGQGPAAWRCTGLLHGLFAGAAVDHCLAIAGLVFDAETVRSQINQQLGMGAEGEKAIVSLVEGAGRPDSGIMATILGIAALIFGATGVFIQLKDALNTIWEVEPKPGGGIWGFVKDRVLSFAMVLAIGFLLLVLLVVSAALHAMQEYVGDLLPMPGWVAQILDIVISIRRRHRFLRFDLQVSAGREDWLARRVAGRDRHRDLVHRGKIPVRAVLGSRSERLPPMARRARS